MTADQAHCLLIPATVAASVLCVVVHIFVVAKYFVGVGLEHFRVCCSGQQEVAHKTYGAKQHFSIHHFGSVCKS